MPSGRPKSDSRSMGLGSGMYRISVTLEDTFAGQVDGAAGTFVPLPLEAEMVREECRPQLTCIGPKYEASRLQELEYLWTKPAVQGRLRAAC